MLEELYDALKKMPDEGGLTLKDYKPIVYKTGYQVGLEGKQRKTIKAALNVIKKYDGNCGIWYSGGIYYIDKSKRITTKKDALAEGRRCKQISILKWSNMSLVYC